MKPDCLPIGRLTATLLGCLWISGCGQSGPGSDGRPGGPLVVVCTTGQVADMLRNIGREHVRVESLMGPGVDPHLYKAVPGDVRKLKSADVVFYSGLHLEGRLADLLEKLAERRRRAYGAEQVYAVTDGVRSGQSHLLRKVEGTEEQYDPHVWFDVLLWSKCVDYAAQKLIALDPKHADDYRRNADEYLGQLAELHEWCTRELSRIPKERRVMVTAHDAFRYFGEAYGVDVRGLQGISTADEADQATANELVDLLVRRKVKAVFAESSVPPKRIRSLIEACAARGHRVVEGGQLFSDAMGPEGTPQGEYIGMVKHNVETIVEALK